MLEDYFNYLTLVISQQVEESEPQSTHEEADARVIFHAKYRYNFICVSMY